MNAEAIDDGIVQCRGQEARKTEHEQLLASFCLHLRVASRHLHPCAVQEHLVRELKRHVVAGSCVGREGVPLLARERRVSTALNLHAKLKECAGLARAWVALVALAVAEGPRAHFDRELDGTTGDGPALVGGWADDAVVKEREGRHLERRSADECRAEINAVCGGRTGASGEARC